MKNSIFFCVEKCCNFLYGNRVFFGSENKIFFVGRPVLDTGRDNGTTGQLGTLDTGRDNGTARDAGQWTVDSGQDRVDRTTVLTLEY